MLTFLQMGNSIDVTQMFQWSPYFPFSSGWLHLITNLNPKIKSEFLYPFSFFLAQDYFGGCNSFTTLIWPRLFQLLSKLGGRFSTTWFWSAITGVATKWGSGVGAKIWFLVGTLFDEATRALIKADIPTFFYFSHFYKCLVPINFSGKSVLQNIPVKQFRY